MHYRVCVYAKPQNSALCCTYSIPVVAGHRAPNTERQTLEPGALAPSSGTSTRVPTHVPPLAVCLLTQPVHVLCVDCCRAAAYTTMLHIISNSCHTCCTNWRCVKHFVRRRMCLYISAGLCCASACVVFHMCASTFGRKFART